MGGRADSGILARCHAGAFDVGCAYLNKSPSKKYALRKLNTVEIEMGHRGGGEINMRRGRCLDAPSALIAAGRWHCMNKRVDLA